MERLLERDGGFVSALLGAGIIVAIAFTMVVIAYGMESVAPGVHDTFHDFRHVIGMPCH